MTPEPPAVTIDDRQQLARTPAHETALACITAGIEAARPRRVVDAAVALDGDELRIGEVIYDLQRFDEVLVLGGGKAADGVTAALEELLGEYLTGGAVVTTPADEYTRSTPDRDGQSEERPVTRYPGDHPLPTNRNVDATESILDRAGAADENTLILAVVTGGASAMLTAPARNLGVADLRSVSSQLLGAGATIHELNVLRRHCSRVKGGRLATSATPATVVTLAISDVVDDDPATIASGPTVPDASTFEAALGILDQYGLEAPAVRTHLERGAAGLEEETPGPEDPAFEGIDWHLLANGHTAIDAARGVAEGRGYETIVTSATETGEARVVGASIVDLVESIRDRGEPVDPPAVVCAGGEVTVTAPDASGVGGPNQEVALAAANELRERDVAGILASVDTDGIDGPTDAAGAIVDAETVADLDLARGALDRHDSFEYLGDRRCLLRTGPTGTNVNDLRILVVE